MCCLRKAAFDLRHDGISGVGVRVFSLLEGFGSEVDEKWQFYAKVLRVINECYPKKYKTDPVAILQSHEPWIVSSGFMNVSNEFPLGHMSSSELVASCWRKSRCEEDSINFRYWCVEREHRWDSGLMI